jgi:type IV secretory pathway VirB10-like protein
MGEIKTIPLSQKIKLLLFKDAKFLSSKKEVNWKFIKLVSIVGIVVAVVVLLLLPEPKPEVREFHNGTDSIAQTTEQKKEEPNPNQDTWEQMKASQTSASSALKSVGSYSNYLGGGISGGGSSGSSGSSKNHNSSMVLSRADSDSRLSLPSGSVLKVRIVSRVTVSTDPMPVMGIVTSDVVHESMLAIPNGSKLFGEVTFDESTEKAQVAWKSIVMADNRRRDIQAIAITSDGQPGIFGNVRSNALKNVAGNTITRFIGAYAEGSMTRSLLGASTGGAENGFKQAVSETAKDQAEQYGNDLKKEKKWVEIEANIETHAVITAPFQFRDVGVIH